MLQLHTPLHVMTPLGPGWCHFLGDGGDDVEWQVFIVRSGESWWFKNQYVRRMASITEGTHAPSAIAAPPGLGPHVERYRGNGWL